MIYLAILVKLIAIAVNIICVDIRLHCLILTFPSFIPLFISLIVASTFALSVLFSFGIFSDLNLL